MKILSAEQIRKWDEYTIANEPISSLDLMERAAEECAGWLIGHYDHHTSVKIFCAKGNNGGDGLAIARLLANKDFTVDVYILEFGNTGTHDFQANLQRLHSFDVEIHFLQHADFFPLIEEDDLVIDAMYGSGINRPLEGLSAQLVNHINASKAPVVAIDLPSGLYVDKPAEQLVVHATYTLTFQCLRMCFLVPENDSFIGCVTVLDIGLHPDFLATIAGAYTLTDLPIVKEIYRPRHSFAHKGTFGHALIISGEKGKMGAAVLCTRACLRSGAGLVTVIVPEEQFPILQTSAPEAMVAPQQSVESLDWSKYTTVGIGPGIGTGNSGTQSLTQALVQYTQPMVIDADGLNILSTNKKSYKEIPPGSIITPHPKEFERLFGKVNNHYDRIQLARRQAKKLFIYIIVKGHYSVLACPDGEVYFNSTGNPGMATGGSGDVLTGILTGLLATGYSSKEAALLGMYLHGLSADLATQQLSHEALLASDIIKYLGKAWKVISS